MRLILLLLGLIFLAPAPGAAAEREVLRVAVEQDYPPFCFVDQNGVLTGFDVELAQALCAKIGRDCCIIPQPFPAIMPALAQGEIDLAVAGMAATAEREQHVLFTDPYYRGRSIFIELRGRRLDPGPEGAKGLTISVQRHSLQEQYLLSNYGGKAEILSLVEFADVLESVRLGKADLCLVDGLPAYAYLRSAQGAELEPASEPLPMLAEEARIAVSKRLPQLRESLNAALKEMLSDGQYDRINYTYFEFKIY